MFTPREFSATDLQWLDALFARDAFITLLTPGADGLPELTRLPVLYRREGSQIELSGHWALANPQSRHNGAAKVLVDGPHGYVSAGWYPDKEAQSRVPTWNYAAAELRGTLERFDDPAALAELLAATSAVFDAGVGQAWQFDAQHPPHQRLLRGIVGFRFQVQHVQLKLKLSQNHPVANQQAVIAALEQLPSPPSHELAQWMRRFLELPADAG